MAKKTKRVVFRVLPVTAESHFVGWRVTRSDWPASKTSPDYFRRADGFKKSDAITHAVDEARYVRERGGLSQVVIHGRNGEIQKEYTYGEDPKRTKG